MIRLFQIDSFTDIPFRGNPAAVCLLEKPVADEWMRQVAQEMNLSETAFFLQRNSNNSLRWFTPTVEVPLCGHATLATAHVLWEQKIYKPEEAISFETKSGTLVARKVGDTIELDFPAAQVVLASAPSNLFSALGLKDPPKFYGLKDDYGIGFLEVSDEMTVRDLKPNFSQLKSIDIPAVIVTARSKPGSEYDFVSRFFGPGIGIDEDPVTGAAHCALGPYWRKILKKEKLKALQVSARQGSVTIRFQDNRVLLGGKAVTIFEAALKM